MNGYSCIARSDERDLVLPLSIRSIQIIWKLLCSSTLYMLSKLNVSCHKILINGNFGEKKHSLLRYANKMINPCGDSF